MSIGRICTRGAVTVPLGASLEEAAGKMLELGVGAVIVTDGSVAPPAVAGNLTGRDIVRGRLGHCRRRP
ncbi:MAG: CBS domain-containing protein [Steroidobacteraceae bacterium]